MIDDGERVDPGNPRAREEIVIAGTPLSEINERTAPDSETVTLSIPFEDELIRGLNALELSGRFDSREDAIRYAVSEILAKEDENRVPKERCL
jgi:hypothetical protein